MFQGSALLRLLLLWVCTAAEDTAELKLRYLRALREVQTSPNGKDEHLQESADKAEILHEALKKLWPQVKASKEGSRLRQKYEDLKQQAQAADELVEKHYMVNSIAQSNLETIRGEIEAQAPGSMKLLDKQAEKLGLTSPEELPDVPQEHADLRAKAQAYLEALGRSDESEEAPDDEEFKSTAQEYMKAANMKYKIGDGDHVPKITDEEARTRLTSLFNTWKKARDMVSADPNNSAKKMLFSVAEQRFKDTQDLLTSFQKRQVSFLGYDNHEVPHRLKPKWTSKEDKHKLRLEAMEQMGKTLKTYRNAVMMHVEDSGNKAKSMFLQAATERVNDKIHDLKPELQEPAREIVERMMDKVMSQFEQPQKDVSAL